jgi:hypothetical protein
MSRIHILEELAGIIGRLDLPGFLQELRDLDCQRKQDKLQCELRRKKVHEDYAKECQAIQEAKLVLDNLLALHNIKEEKVSQSILGDHSKGSYLCTELTSLAKEKRTKALLEIVETHFMNLPDQLYLEIQDAERLACENSAEVKHILSKFPHCICAVSTYLDSGSISRSEAFPPSQDGRALIIRKRGE